MGFDTSTCSAATSVVLSCSKGSQCDKGRYCCGSENPAGASTSCSQPDDCSGVHLCETTADCPPAPAGKPVITCAPTPPSNKYPASIGVCTYGT